MTTYRTDVPVPDEVRTFYECLQGQAEVIEVNETYARIEMQAEDDWDLAQRCHELEDDLESAQLLAASIPRPTEYVPDVVKVHEDSMLPVHHDQLKHMPPAAKVAIIRAMGFTPMRDAHTRDCPRALDSGLVCNCVPDPTEWAQPKDVIEYQNETWDERRAAALARQAREDQR